MNPAAVAGAPLGTGNVVFVPIQDPAAAPIHFGDQFLVVSEGLHCHLVSIIMTNALDLKPIAAASSP